MKVKRLEKGFIPVTITFETQEEVDKFFALVNHVAISDAIQVGGNWSYILDGYQSKNYCEWHEKLNNIIK